MLEKVFISFSSVYLQGHIAPEFYLLLAKYYYFVDDIINALQSIDKSGITIDNVEELTKRCCILAAEAYCFKGKIRFPASIIKAFTP